MQGSKQDRAQIHPAACVAPAKSMAGLGGTAEEAGADVTSTGFPAQPGPGAVERGCPVLMGCSCLSFWPFVPLCFTSSLYSEDGEHFSFHPFVLAAEVGSSWGQPLPFAACESVLALWFVCFPSLRELCFSGCSASQHLLGMGNHRAPSAHETP